MVWPRFFSDRPVKEVALDHVMVTASRAFSTTLDLVSSSAPTWMGLWRSPVAHRLYFAGSTSSQKWGAPLPS